MELSEYIQEGILEAAKAFPRGTAVHFDLMVGTGGGKLTVLAGAVTCGDNAVAVPAQIVDRFKDTEGLRLKFKATVERADS